MKAELDKIITELKWSYDEKKAQIVSNSNSKKNRENLLSIQGQIESLIKSRNDIIKYYSEQRNYLTNFKIRASEINRNLNSF